MNRLICSLMLAALTAVPGWAGPLDPPAPPAPTLIPGLRPSTPITALPITIEQSGRYHLTASFFVPSPTANGITVRADDVEIDLAGFTIRGPGLGSFTGAGVSAETAKRVTVRNGTIRDFGLVGVFIGGFDLSIDESIQGLVEDLRIQDCAAGVALGVGGRARRVRAVRCELVGIQVFFGGEVIDCTVVDCGRGIGGFFPSTITRCSVLLCENDGIDVLGPTLVSQCTVTGVQGDAFQGTSGTVFENCVANFCAGGFVTEDRGTVRDCTARNCSVEGIATTGSGGSGLITGCHVENTPIGIRVDLPSRVEGNYINGASTVGIQVDATDVTVLDNVVMNTPQAINDLGMGQDCLYGRNTSTSGFTYGPMATFGPDVLGASNLNDDADSDHPMANITH